MTKWLITGGAGYIGSHVVRKFQEHGHEVAIFDDFSTGSSEFLPRDVQVITGDIRDSSALAQALEGAGGVVHLAGYKYASESVKYPKETLDVNVNGTQNLLQQMRIANIHKLIFSSSSSVYGKPADLPATEVTKIQPESPYAESKVLAENLITAEPGLNSVILRYFNVVGSGYSEINDRSPYNLFPIVIEKFANRIPALITGSDFDTPDGTAIRDYIHVSDIATAHLKAANYLDQNSPIKLIANLSTGVGYSVLQIMNEFKSQLGDAFTFDFVPRRIGDPAVIYGDSQLARTELGWSPQFVLKDMVASAIQVANL